MSQNQWILVMLVAGACLVFSAAAHDTGRLRFASLVWAMAILLLATFALSILAGPA